MWLLNHVCVYSYHIQAFKWQVHYVKIFVICCCWHWQQIGCYDFRQLTIISLLCVFLDKPSEWIHCDVSTTKGPSYWRKLPSTGSIYTTNFSRITSFTACCRWKCFRYEIVPGTWWIRSGIFHTAVSCIWIVAHACSHRDSLMEMHCILPDGFHNLFQNGPKMPKAQHLRITYL